MKIRKNKTHRVLLLSFLQTAQLIILSAIPLLAGAVWMPPISTNYLFERSAYFVNATVAILVGVATLVFFLGVIKYVLARGNEDELSEGRRYMVWGIIGLAVIASAWGLANLIIFTVFGDTTFSIPIIGDFGGFGGAGNAQNQALTTCPMCLQDPNSITCTLCLNAAAAINLKKGI